MSSPYENLPSTAFWRAAVVEARNELPASIYKKKFDIAKSDGVATAGSCFAQHIARHLRSEGFNVLNYERAPSSLTRENAQRFGYGIYSARYGNIYTVRQLLQLVNQVRGKFSPGGWIWERNGRFFDALRPGVEPDGLDSVDEVTAHREYHIGRVRKLLRNTDVFIFTLGLTEAWVHNATGTVFPTAPGTIADAPQDEFSFKNFTHAEVYADFLSVKRILQRIKPTMRFIITVSPVPLTATASGEHVLAATVYSKSVLRAVAGEVSSGVQDVDYFPSYELIASHVAPKTAFEPNLRSVSSSGVASAMHAFIDQHKVDHAVLAAEDQSSVVVSDTVNDSEESDDVVCEEMLLDAFLKKGP